MTRAKRAWRPLLTLPVALACILVARAAIAAPDVTHLDIVGGLAGVSQYTKLEEPFWTRDLEARSNGRIKAEIHPFDRSGLPGQEMLQLMHLGVVPFGTALLAVVSGDEPELNAVDLPALNPDIATLRQTVRLYRPHLRDMLHDKYGIELLAIYAYPAQVIYCAKPFKDLAGLAGLRVRTSSVGQSELITALRGVPVIVPFADMVNAIRTNQVDCAITGTLSGNEIGLSDVTSFVSPIAISWGLSFFGANLAAWNALPADIMQLLRAGIADLEQQIWTAAERETALGLACDMGAASCTTGRPGRMTLVPGTMEDEALRKRLLIEHVLPSWVARCGPSCVAAWNTTLAGATGITIPAD